MMVCQELTDFHLMILAEGIGLEVFAFFHECVTLRLEGVNHGLLLGFGFHDLNDSIVQSRCLGFEVLHRHPIKRDGGFIGFFHGFLSNG